MLYHYTNLQGLTGIISNQNIWASHCEYLNDASEFKHAFNSIKNIAEGIYMEDEYLSVFAFHMRQAIDRIGNHDSYITSFSTNPDSLSQWRGYNSAGQGVCIGFNQEIIEEYCKENQHSLIKCLYLHNEQEKIIINIINDCLNIFPNLGVSRKSFDTFSSQEMMTYNSDLSDYISNGDGADESTEALCNLCETLNNYAPIMKNNGFHEESEWRIICNNPDKNIFFREAPSHLIPYLELPLIKYSNDVISEVIIGPNPNMSRCVQSIHKLLVLNGLTNVKVGRSEIPFNSW
ncbi:MAG: DUF2971 domain-containing protein [Piscirickettsiaceae bacterium]|nr:DUF2971 domain-containing protein [Piscirickettsiaceae bacterium]